LGGKSSDMTPIHCRERSFVFCNRYQCVGEKWFIFEAEVVVQRLD
jgi:hypothetical protein